VLLHNAGKSNTIISQGSQGATADKGENMSINYPPSVSGFEYEIAGGNSFDSVRAETCYNEECKMFEVEDVESDVEIETRYDTEYFSWECPTCKVSRDIENNVEGER
jgi:rubredoxin